jgi:hypothetical protein
VALPRHIQLSACPAALPVRSANDWALLLFWPATAALDAAVRAAAVPRADKLAVLRALDDVETALALVVLLRLAAHAVNIYTLSDVVAAVEGSAGAVQRAMAGSLRKLRGGMALHPARPRRTLGVSNMADGVHPVGARRCATNVLARRDLLWPALALLPASASADSAGKFTTVTTAKRRYYGRVKQGVYEFLAMGRVIKNGELQSVAVRGFFADSIQTQQERVKRQCVGGGDACSVEE